MKLTGEGARAIVEDENTDWHQVVGTREIIGTGRWSIYYTAVFEYVLIGRFYRFNWAVGATESQDERPFEYDKEYEPQEVTKQEKMMEVWEEVTLWARQKK